jgi:beta-galactosidase
MNKLLIGVLVFISTFFNYSHAQRINYTINSGWYFRLGDCSDFSGKINPSEWQIVNLPHTWNAVDAFNDVKGYYRGAGCYLKELRVPTEWKNKRVNLYFEGANQETEVYVNSTKVGSHNGGYTAFSFDISSFLKFDEKNLIMVRMNNRHNENIPPLGADFNFYGGIYRNVRLIVTEPIHFSTNDNASDGVFVETPNVSEQKAFINVSGHIENNLPEKKNVEVETIITDNNNNVIVSKTINIVLLPNKTGDFKIEKIEIDNPNLWSPNAPYLYKLTTIIKNKGKETIVFDAVNLPVGLRWFGFDEQNRFLLNGKPLKLIGTNRHQDFKGKGNALTDSYHWNDFKKIKDLGFNFVRLAHYPQAKEVYRACDELGLLVWSEIPIVNEITQTNEFTDNCLLMQQEHIRQTRNHPCVIFYGYMNEIFIKMSQNKNLTEDGRKQIAEKTVELAKRLNALTKAEAPDRKTVMALHYDEAYNKYGIANIPDVIGWNLYFGWYYETLEDLSRFLSEQHSRYPNRPMIVSEFGTDADIRNHTTSPMPWDFSEDYQYKFHSSYLKQMLEMPYLAGFASWNFADFGSNGRANAIPFVNQKGLVTYDRIEKDICGLYRAYFSEKPIVHIALTHYTKQSGLENTENKGKCITSVKIFSNGKEVELTLNGKSLVRKVVIDKTVDFMVPFIDGQNQLVATDERGINDKITIQFVLIPTQLNQFKVTELAINVGSKQTFFETESQTLWLADKEYTSGSWGYSGGSPYIQKDVRIPKTGVNSNIIGTNSNPLFQTFVEGINSYRFDVKDGTYVVTLCFEEYNTKKPKDAVLYNLSSVESDKTHEGVREFNVNINNTKVLEKLNLFRDFGPLKAVTYEFTISAENGSGIKVDFQSVSGKSVLSGIKIKSLY